MEYRCIYIHNEHGSLSLTSAKVWIETNTANAKDMIDIALDEAGKDGTADTIVDDDVTLGYAVGSRWYDVTGDAEYVCVDATDGVAVWKKTTP